MKKSAFQFSNPCLRNVVFEINPTYESADGEEIEVKIVMNVETKRVKQRNEAFVELKVEIGEKENAPFWISVSEGAKFRWADEITDANVDKFLKQNAPALLLGYVRPVVSFITSASPYSAYEIPFVSFTE